MKDVSHPGRLLEVVAVLCILSIAGSGLLAAWALRPRLWASEEAGWPLLVMISGRHRVDTEALAVRLALAEIRRTSPEQVRAATGQAIGGVAPVGHPEPRETIVDVSLADYDRLWVAGGTPHTILPLSYRELVTITSRRQKQVGD